MPTRLKIRHRPNKDCLFCGAELTRPPNTQRAFYYCGEDCWRPCNKSVRFFNPELKGKVLRAMVEGQDERDRLINQVILAEMRAHRHGQIPRRIVR